MHHRSFRTPLLWSLVLVVLIGCDPQEEADVCSEDPDCDDGVSCNGEEVCFPGAPKAGDLPGRGVGGGQLQCGRSLPCVRRSAHRPRGVRTARSGARRTSCAAQFQNCRYRSKNSSPSANLLRKVQPQPGLAGRDNHRCAAEGSKYATTCIPMCHAHALRVHFCTPPPECGVASTCRVAAASRHVEGDALC